MVIKKKNSYKQNQTKRNVKRIAKERQEREERHLRALQQAEDRKQKVNFCLIF
jgi:hypothetical protein